MNLYDGIAVLGMLAVGVGFVHLFLKGKRVRGLVIIVVAIVTMSFGAMQSLDKEAHDRGFANYEDQKRAFEAGITDPAVFEAKKADLVAAEAEKMRQAEAAEAAANAAAIEKKRLAEAAAADEKRRAEAAAAAAAAERAAKQAAEDAFYAPPPAQMAVIAAVQEAVSNYKAAANDLAKGGVRRERAKALCAAQPNRSVSGWTGVLKTLSTNGDGLGVVEVELSDEVTLKTWNNALSDIGSGTLIDPDTAVFKKLAQLKEGARVKFSGQFMKTPGAPDCFDEGSLSMSGAIHNPEFIFKFADVQTYRP